MIDVITSAKKPRKSRAFVPELRLADVVGRLRVLANYTTAPTDITDFAETLRLMGPVTATEFLRSGPPSVAWIERLLAQLPPGQRVRGSGYETVTLALKGRARMV